MKNNTDERRNITLDQIPVGGRIGSELYGTTEKIESKNGQNEFSSTDQKKQGSSQNTQTSQQNGELYFEEDFLIFNKKNDNKSKGKSEKQQPAEQKQSLFENIFAKKNKPQLTFITSYLDSTQEQKNQIKSNFVGLDDKKSSGEKSDFVFVKDCNKKIVGVANRNFNCENKDDTNNFLIIVQQKGFSVGISQEYLKLNDAELTKFLGCLGVVRENVAQGDPKGEEEKDSTESKPSTGTSPLSATQTETGVLVKQNRNGDILDAVAQAVLLYNGNKRFGLRQTGFLSLEGENLDIKFANENAQSNFDEIKDRAINNFKYLFQRVCQEKSIVAEGNNEVLTFSNLTDGEKQHVSSNLQEKIETIKQVNQQTR